MVHPAYPKSLSVVIPVYNSENTLEELVSRLGNVLPALCPEYEVILVNDGSRDQSWQRICQLARQLPWVNGIQLMRNYGQHNALLCGVREARGEVTITMDDDLQHPPEEIYKLLDKLGEGFDVVFGYPEKLPHSWWRNWFSILTKYALSYVMGFHTVRDISSFRAFRTDLRRAFTGYQNPSVLLDVLLSWGTTNFGVVKVQEEQRSVGKSNYGFTKLFNIAMDILTGYSTAPLRFTSMIGFLFTIFGFLVFLYVVIIYLAAGSIPGFPFLASIISIFSGTQLFALGIIGEYLARVFDRSVDRPVYVVRENTQQPDEALRNAGENPTEAGGFSADDQNPCRQPETGTAADMQVVEAEESK